MSRRTYSAELRHTVLARLRAGESAYAIARDLNLPTETVKFWRRNAGIAPGTARKVPQKSGVIAGPTYRRGMVWGYGWGVW